MNAIVTDPPWEAFCKAYDKALTARRVRISAQAEYEKACTQQAEAVRALELATTALREQTR